MQEFDQYALNRPVINSRTGAVKPLSWFGFWKYLHDNQIYTKSWATFQEVIHIDGNAPLFDFGTAYIRDDTEAQGLVKNYSETLVRAKYYDNQDADQLPTVVMQIVQDKDVSHDD